MTLVSLVMTRLENSSFFASSTSKDCNAICRIVYFPRRQDDHFDSESIENIGKGMRARENHKILNDNEFTETFEGAEPGKEFIVYSANNFKRKKQ